MRRCWVVVAGLAGLAGCHTEKYKTTVKHPEEYTVPPDDPRYNNPPESGYKPPPKKKDFTPGFNPGGGMGMPNGGMGGGGMGGPGMGGM